MTRLQICYFWCKYRKYRNSLASSCNPSNLKLITTRLMDTNHAIWEFENVIILHIQFKKEIIHRKKNNQSTSFDAFLPGRLFLFFFPISYNNPFNIDWEFFPDKNVSCERMIIKKFLSKNQRDKYSANNVEPTKNKAPIVGLFARWHRSMSNLRSV